MVRVTGRFVIGLFFAILGFYLFANGISYLYLFPQFAGIYGGFTFVGFVMIFIGLYFFAQKDQHREIRTIQRGSAPGERVVETKIVERVLVICPYCGKKNEQGVPKCEQCGAGF